MRVAASLAGGGFSTVVNGRFKGGYITRHYGNPTAGVHVLQLEMAWRTYIDEAHPQLYDTARAAPLVAILRRVADALLRA